MRRRYTVKYSSSQKPNPKYDFEVQLHTYLNRIDIEKDAYKCDSPIEYNKNEFKTYADSLFGPLPFPSYEKSLAYMKTILQKYESNEKKLLIISKYEDAKLATFLPKYIKYGIQDAGLSPRQYRNDIQIITTPGSYLDPASRTKGDYDFGFEDIVINSQFTNIGMHMIDTMNVELNKDDKSCTVSIQIQEIGTIETQFNASYKPIRGDIEYFKGNSEKNKFIDSTEQTKVEAIKHILCKELGDTLQAYYAFTLLQLFPGTSPICLFTNDTILTLRCKLMRIPVTYNVCVGKLEKQFYFYPIMTSVTEEFYKLWKQHIEDHHDMVINGVRHIILKGNYMLLNGKNVSLRSNPDILRILQNYVRLVQIRTSEFLAIDGRYLETEEYRRKSILYRMPRLFIHDVLNSAAINMSFFNDADRVILMGNSASMKGGGGDGDRDLPEIMFETEEDNYTIDREYSIDTYLPAVITKHVLYRLFTNIHPEIHKHTICYMTEMISSILYLYFNYIGGYTSDEMFLRKIVEQFEAETFGKQTFDEFENAFNIFNKHFIKQTETSDDIQALNSKLHEEIASPFVKARRFTRKKRKFISK